MLPALILALAALGFALLRLWAYRAQLLEMARTLEETPPESNLRLTVGMSGKAPRRLCQAVNRRLEEGRQLVFEMVVAAVWRERGQAEKGHLPSECDLFGRLALDRAVYAGRTQKSDRDLFER